MRVPRKVTWTRNKLWQDVLIWIIPGKCFHLCIDFFDQVVRVTHDCLRDELECRCTTAASNFHQTIFLFRVIVNQWHHCIFSLPMAIMSTKKKYYKAFFVFHSNFLLTPAIQKANKKITKLLLGAKRCF